MLTRILGAAMLAALVLLPGLQAQASPPRKWAVVIGIDQYENRGVSPLAYAVADARALARTLRTSAGFAADDVFELTSDKTGDEAPTRTNIAFRFDYLARQVQPGDDLLVFFSGHGVEVDGETFLLTREADPRSHRTLQQSALHARDLFGWLQATRAGRVLLVVDACRNEPNTARGMGDNQLTQALARDLAVVDVPKQGRGGGPAACATLFACSAGQRSYEWNDRGHGFFTWFLMQGLQGQANDGKGQVTLASLVDYVQRNVADASMRWTLNRQEPWIRYEGPGAHLWVLADGPAAQPVAAAPQPVASAPQPVAAAPAPQPAGPESVPSPAAAPQPVAAAAAPPVPPAPAEVAAAPAVLRVSREGGSPYRTLGHALQEAPAGSRIVVAPGIYHETVVVRKPVEIVGEDGAVLRATGGHAVEVRTSGRVVLEGLTLDVLNRDEAVLGQATLEDVKVVERELSQGPRIERSDRFRLGPLIGPPVCK